MATPLPENESVNTAVDSLNRAQRAKLNTFIEELQRAYSGVVTIEENNITINLNDYIKTNKDKVYNDELTNIKASIENFCEANPKFKNHYVNVEAPVKVDETDGRRRKTKRSPSKKSIKSKRKY
jgi:hypothetical protein